jgi:uncharacterized protein (DUF486 family)
MKTWHTIILLILSNTFMTIAWYGHLKIQNTTDSPQVKPLYLLIVVSWGIAFFEYCFQVPANRIGYSGNGGPFSLVELKILQEVITLSIFIIFTLIMFKGETFNLNHVFSFLCIIAAVYFAFKK